MAEKVISRRVLTKGAAWAAPVTIIGTAAPAFASSQVDGLNGWVEPRADCRSGRLIIDGRGTYPDRGLWVYPVASSTVTVEEAKITFYLPSSRVNGSFSMVQTSSWTTPTLDPTAPTKANYSAYTTLYKGSWTYVSGASQMRVTSFPVFSIPIKNVCGRPLPVTARRSVVVGGNTIVVERSVTLGGPTSYSAETSEAPSDAVEAQDAELLGVV